MKMSNIAKVHRRHPLKRGNFGEYGENDEFDVERAPLIVVILTKWRIWRKFCQRFGEYSNWVAEGVPWIVDFVENGESGENTKNAKVSQGSFAEHDSIGFT